jgi:hypothetical protein
VRETVTASDVASSVAQAITVSTTSAPTTEIITSASRSKSVDVLDDASTTITETTASVHRTLGYKSVFQANRSLGDD